MTLTPWRARAVCALETSGAPELWTSDRRPTGVVAAEMEAMCHRCPVRADCARWALDTAADTGMYAGVWVPERSQIQAWQGAHEDLRRIAALSVAVAVVA